MGRTQNVDRATLEEVEIASKELGRAERRRDEAIYRAHLAGNSLRVIADSTGLSHETVRSIVERMQKWVRRESKYLDEYQGLGSSPSASDRNDANHRRRSEHLRKLLSVKIPDS